MKGKKAEGHVTKRFIIPSEQEFIQKTLKGASFNSKEDFIEKVIDKMNYGKPRSYYKWKEPGEKFLHVKCSICKNFQLWFTFKKTLVSGAITDITYNRTINKGHLKEKHRQGEF